MDEEYYNDTSWDSGFGMDNTQSFDPSAYDFSSYFDPGYFDQSYFDSLTSPDWNSYDWGVPADASQYDMTGTLDQLPVDMAVSAPQDIFASTGSEQIVTPADLELYNQYMSAFGPDTSNSNLENAFGLGGGSSTLNSIIGEVTGAPDYQYMDTPASMADTYQSISGLPIEQTYQDIPGVGQLIIDEQDNFLGFKNQDGSNAYYSDIANSNLAAQAAAVQAPSQKQPSSSGSGGGAPTPKQQTPTNTAGKLATGLGDLAALAGIFAKGKKAPVGVGTSRAADAMTWKRFANGGPIGGQSNQRGALGLLAGGTSGQSDKVDAKVSHGEYVMDADVVSALGDGNTEAGAAKLDQMRQAVRQHKRSAPASKIPPAAKSPLQYMKGAK